MINYFVLKINYCQNNNYAIVKSIAITNYYCYYYYYLSLCPSVVKLGKLKTRCPCPVFSGQKSRVRCVLQDAKAFTQ